MNFKNKINIFFTIHLYSLRIAFKYDTPYRNECYESEQIQNNILVYCVDKFRTEVPLIILYNSIVKNYFCFLRYPLFIFKRYTIISHIRFPYLNVLPN